MRKLKPLAGQVLIEVLQAPTQTAGGIAIPSRHKSPEEVQESHLDPVKPGAITGIVRACGAWPKLPCGLTLMPDFGIGARVLLRPEVGVDLRWSVGDRLKLVRQKDVLAVVSSV
jgi:co-chaperonin GroES (HSP10)